MSENEYGLEEIHSMLLDGLIKFDEICQKNNIKYSLHGGALLGAERNGHLIPWDDDLDISMKRSEYIKFRETVSEKNNEYTIDEEMTWLPRFVVSKNKKSVFIDIFIWDYISENKLSQAIKINFLRVLQGTMKTHIEYSKFNLFYKIILFTTHVIGLLIPFGVKHKFFNYVCEKCFCGSKRFIHRSNDSFRGCKYIFDNEYMESYRNILLENRKFMVNERYKEFLVMEYGEDYLTPPPVEMRHPSHQFALNDLNS